MPDTDSTKSVNWSYSQTLDQTVQTIIKLVNDDGWNYSKYQIIVQDGVIQMEIEINNG